MKRTLQSMALLSVVFYAQAGLSGSSYPLSIEIQNVNITECTASINWQITGAYQEHTLSNVIPDPIPL